MLVLLRFSIWTLRSASEIFCTSAGISVDMPYFLASGSCTSQGEHSIESRPRESRNSLLMASFENSFLSRLEASFHDQQRRLHGLSRSRYTHEIASGPTSIALLPHMSDLSSAMIRLLFRSRSSDEINWSMYR